MCKVIFIQKCFKLSDLMAEEMLMDRIIIRRLVGLSFDDATPDHTTISTFRKRLRERGHASTLFDTALEVLLSRELVMNEGTLVDATIIEAPLGSKRQDGSSTADPCARKTSSTADRTTATAPTSPQTPKASSPITSTIPARGSEHTHFDHLHVREMVEHPFAWIKRMAGGRTRYRGITRNAFDFALPAVVYNFRRSVTIKPLAAPRAGSLGAPRWRKPTSARRKGLKMSDHRPHRTFKDRSTRKPRANQKSQMRVVNCWACLEVFSGRSLA